VRVGARVFWFFAVSVLLTSILGAVVNDKVEEAWQHKMRVLMMPLAQKS